MLLIVEVLTDFFVTRNITESGPPHHGLVFMSCYLPYLALGPEMDPHRLRLH